VGSELLLKKLLDRNNILALILSLLAIALVSRLIQLQIVQGDYYYDLSENKRIRQINVEAPRGSFLDRFGREIAGNRPGYVVEISVAEVIDDRLVDVLEQTVGILDKNGDALRTTFPISLDPVGFNFNSKAEEESWRKRYKVPPEHTAYQAFQLLKEQNKIPADMPDHTAIKVLSIMHAIKEQGYRSYQPVEIARDVSMETVAHIEEKRLDLPGINVEVKPIRHYKGGSLAAHVLGYLGSINQSELEQLREKGYDHNDIIGKSGLEKVMEERLKGVDGAKHVEVDALGRLVKTLGEVSPVPGSNVTLTLDAELQRAAEQSLQQTLKQIQDGELGEKYVNAKAGAVVAIDVNNGAVLAMASSPSYDPNIFSTGISSEDWLALNPQTDNPMAPRPMYNNAIQAALPPGSTFKMITGIAAMEEGVVKPETIIIDRGVYTVIPGARPACWIWNSRRSTHGPENMMEAIRDSCNYYFYEVSRLLGIEKLEEYAKRFGLGQKTGIEIPGESQGLVAGPTYKTAVWRNTIRRYMVNEMGIDDEELIESIQGLMDVQFGSWNQMVRALKDMGITEIEHINKLISYINGGKWMPGQTLSAAIGQGEHMYTPLQMANYIATLANGGTRYRPQLVRSVYNQNTGQYETFAPEVVDNIDIDPQNLKAVFEGMNAVTRPGGTSWVAFRDLPFEVAGKTGTAQNPGYDDNAWFVGFAPYDDPQIAVAVLIMQGGHGSYAAPVAKAIFEEYLGVGREGIKILHGNTLAR
jgi:penicillin-binding protein 2